MSAGKGGGFGGRGGGPGGPGGDIMKVGDKARDTKGTLKRLLQLTGAYKVGLIAVVVFTLLATIAGNLGPRIIGFAINEIQLGVERMMAGTGGINTQTVVTFLVILVGLYLINALLTYAQQHIMAGITQKTMYTLRSSVDKKIKSLPLSYFDKQPLGDILSRVTNDVDTVSNSLQQSVTQIFSSVLGVLAILIMMIVVSPALTIIALLTLPLTVLFSAGVIKRSQPLFAKQQKSLGQLGGFVEEMYSGHTVVKAYGKEQEVALEFEKINEERYQSSYRANFISGIIMPLSNLVSNLGYVAVVIVGGIMVINGQLLIGDIQSFSQYLRNFSQPISQLAQIANTLQSTIAAAERVFDFLDEQEEVKVSGAVLPPQNKKGDVEMEHVAFGYTPDNTLIKDLSLKVESGQTIAIVGPTGAGKTTLVNLLLRFYDINSGVIRIDGTDISAMDRVKLRGYFGMVLQDTWLFGGTIRENIRYGKLDATDSEVEAAAKAAYAHGFIQSLPNGYDTELSEDASNISQGQRQLLTIARAILSNPYILILDEATSSVDTRTEVLIQRAMKGLMQGRTSFVIAHRLSTIRDADKILVLEKGDIVEMGNHDELLQKGGFYSRLYNSQFAHENAG